MMRTMETLLTGITGVMLLGACAIPVEPQPAITITEEPRPSITITEAPKPAVTVTQDPEPVVTVTEAPQAPKKTKVNKRAIARVAARSVWDASSVTDQGLMCTGWELAPSLMESEFKSTAGDDGDLMWSELEKILVREC